MSYTNTVSIFTLLFATAGEGIYHAAVLAQDEFRKVFMGMEYWNIHVASFKNLLQARDLWCIFDVYSFGICGNKIPDGYHDLNYEEAHIIRRRAKKAAHDIEKAEKRRKSSIKAKEKRRANEEHYHNAHMENKNKAHIRNSADITIVEIDFGRKTKPRLGPGGLDPTIVLAQMPEIMKDAFVQKKLGDLRMIAEGRDKTISKEDFWLYMQAAEDAGLWEPNHNHDYEGGSQD